MAIQSYQDLEVWQRARRLVLQTYTLTRQLPPEEKFGLISQIRRAAVSIPANIAEGWARHYPAEFIQFLRTANGSRAELETHLVLAADLGFLHPDQIAPIIEETAILGRQLLTLERRLNQ